MRRFFLLCALFIVCSSAAFAQEDKVTQGVVTTTTNTTYTTVTQTKQVRMSDEEWAEYKRQKREARKVAADSLHTVKLANIEQQRLARKERLANRPPLTGGVGWKNYVNINLSGVVEYASRNVSTPSIGIEYIGGKRFNRVVFLGFGTGVIFNTNTAVDSELFYNGYYYRDKDLGLCVASIPLYANFRLYMASGKWQPYFSLSTGFRFSGKKSEQISAYDILSSTAETEFKNTIYDIEYGSTQYFLSPGFGIDFLGKSGKGVSVQASLFAITRPWMRVEADDYYGTLYVDVHHSMGVGYHVQIGFIF